jgi:alpha-L-rhamnosidase
MKFRVQTCLGFLVLGLSFSATPQSDPLKRGFENPPNNARPRVWWHWMNGNVTKEGIQLDLEWMKRVGIGGLQNFDAALATPQVVEKRLAYMTPEWKDAFRYAVGLADELGLEMAIASSPGWSETGGPWVKPEQGLKKLVWSELQVQGGTRFTGTLPKPPSVTGPFQSVPHREEIPLPGTTPAPPPAPYYNDAAVVAYRLPTTGLSPAEVPVVTSNAGPVDAALLADGDLLHGVKVPTGADGGWLQYEYAALHTIHAATLARPAVSLFMSAAPFAFRLESSDNGQTFRAVADFPPTHVPQETVSFPPVTARYFRLRIQNAPPVGMIGGFELTPGVDLGMFGAMARGGAKTEAEVNELILHSTPRVNRFEEKAGFGLVPDYYAITNPAVDTKNAVARTDVVDLTTRMKSDGSLDWTPPAGQWVILRLGYSLTGTTNHPATKEATGLEVDKLDQQAVKSYIDTYLGTYLETLGPQLMGRRGVKALLTDSIEVGAYNWTPDLLVQFKRLRGYDPTPFLPTLTGVVIGSAEQSDNFLWDFRRTLGELTAQSHYGQIAKSAHERGLTSYGESLLRRVPRRDPRVDRR